MNLMTPSQLFLKLSWVNIRPASSFFTPGTRKKFASGEVWRIGWVGDHLHGLHTKKSTTKAEVWTRALSLCRNQSFEDMMGLFCLNT
jgi:hypothetical protein